MQMEDNYNIYTDASFDDALKLGTYAIIVMQENKIVKSISKKCRIKVENSTECEVFAIYEAINIILNCFINKNKLQKFCIKTDCAIAREFFINNNKIKIFKENSDMLVTMKDVYKKLSKKLAKKDCSFKIKWISRKSNKIAHKYSYSIFQKLKVSDNRKELLLIDKNVFMDILLKLNKIQYTIIIYLINNSNEEKLINITQKEVANDLNVSTYEINRCFKLLMNLSILQKIKNGKYFLLI